MNYSFLKTDQIVGMTVLDRSKFTQQITVPCIKVKKYLMQEANKLFRDYLLRLPKIKEKVVDDDDDDGNNLKTIILDPDQFHSLSQLNLDPTLLKSKLQIDETAVSSYQLELDYSNWPHDAVLKAVIPEQVQAAGQVNVRGFSQIGHIAHFNLKDEMLPYGKLIGEVIIDKIATVKTVLNKKSEIESEYRNFENEILAGDPNTEVVVKENGCSYQFDFAKVYWNPRLATERQRVTDCLQAGDVLYDLFAGVGPFAVPALTRQCDVVANDLNPESYRWLCHNAAINTKSKKRKFGKFTAFNKDAGEFMCTEMAAHLVALWRERRDVQTHVVMNLPAIAIDFLPRFRGLLAAHAAELPPRAELKEPIVYCYCFERGQDTAKAQAMQRVSDALGQTPVFSSVRNVRKVAPNKDMFCLIFRLPFGCLLSDEEAPSPKKPRVE